MIGHVLGRLLKNVHAGEDKLVWNHPAVHGAPVSLHLSSPAFEPDGPIPVQYAGEGVGKNISPPLRWSNIPTSAVELALVIEDPDAPLPTPFVHLIAVNIPPTLPGMEEGALKVASAEIRLGRGTFGRLGYSGPRALPGHGPHVYVFQLFALSSKLSFSRPPTRQTLLQALPDKIIARGRLNGFFERG